MNISAAEIPNLPGLGGAPAPMQIPGMPDIRRRAPGGYIPAREAPQQGPLPEGFSQGLERAVGAVGRTADVIGSMGPVAARTALAAGAPGQAMGEGMQGLGGQIGKLSEIMAAEARQTQIAQDAAAVSEADLAMETKRMAFESEASTLPPGARQALWKEKYAPEMYEGVSGFGASPEGQQKIMLQARRFDLRTQVEINREAIKATQENARASINNDIERSVKNQDWEAAHEANARGLEAGLWGKAQFDEQTLKIGERQREAYRNADMANDPVFVRDEAGKALKGEKSNYPELNKDKALAQNTWQAAQHEITRRTHEATDSLARDMASGRAVTEEEINKRLDNIGATQAEKNVYIKAARENVPYAPGRLSKIRTAVMEYDGIGDNDAAKYREIQLGITSQVPQEMRKELQEELNRKFQDGLQGKLPSAAEQALKDGFDMIEKVRDLGLLRTTAGEPLETGKPERGKKMTPEQQAAWLANDQRAIALQDELKQWQKDNPKAGRLEMHEQVAKMLGPEVQKNAGDILKAPSERPPRATPVYPMGSPATGAPVYMPRTMPPTEEQFRAKQGAPLSAAGEAQLRAGERGSLPDVTDHTVRKVTAYRPGGGSSMGLSSKVEGGIKDARGNVILGRTTMEDYLQGRGPYVTVAMDKTADWQNHYLVSPKFPGVVFRVMDNGGYGNNRTGRNWIDIAWKDPDRAKRWTANNVDFRVVSPEEARRIAAARRGSV